MKNEREKERKINNNEEKMNERRKEPKTNNKEEKIKNNKIQHSY